MATSNFLSIVMKSKQVFSAFLVVALGFSLLLTGCKPAATPSPEKNMEEEAMMNEENKMTEDDKMEGEDAMMEDDKMEGEDAMMEDDKMEGEAMMELDAEATVN